MVNFLIINLVNVIRRRQKPHVKETTEGINNKLHGKEEDVMLRTGTVLDLEPFV